jgi:hypothetical protein
MNLYPVQVSLLSALQSAAYYREKSPSLAKGFDDYAIDVYNNKAFKNQIEFLVERKLINEQGQITKKGSAVLNFDPRLFSNTQLGITTNFCLSTGVERGTLENTLDYLHQPELEALMAAVYNVVASRINKGVDASQILVDACKQVVEASLMEFEDNVQDFEHVEMLHDNWKVEEVVEIEQEEVQVQVVTAKKSRSKKATV